MSFDDFRAYIVEQANSSPGNLEGVDCPICLNRGTFIRIRDKYEFVEDCVCMERRRTLKNIRDSGLEHVLNTRTLDTFTVADEWQRRVKDTAVRYLAAPGTPWFFIGGQVGAGKTHICTAIAGDLINRGVRCRYVRWVEIVRELKSCINDDEAYDRLMSPLQTVPVLYIDDFLKIPRGAEPKEADLRVAYDLIDARYCSDKRTIISSEHMLIDIVETEESVGSRIREKARGYTANLDRNIGRNYRMRDENEI